MNAEQKKSVVVAAFTGTKTVTQIAIEIKSSRKFVRGQKAKATDAIDAAFDPAKEARERYARASSRLTTPE